MSIPRTRFIEELRRSGVVADAALDRLLADFPNEDAMPTGRFAQELVRRELLTSYQAKRLCEGEPIMLGDYAILSLLGEGGMGMVFRARHAPMGRVVALKVIRDKHLDAPGAVERFDREVRAAARLSHPNIVRAYDAGIRNGRHFLAMELIDGPTLAELVRSQGPLPVPKAVACIVQAAQGLACAHEHGIVHRDVKPRNLILDPAGTVKVLDLGVARLVTDQLTAEDSVTLTGELLGTFDYMAPEQAMDAKAVDQRSDIYSLGCTLFYLLTGKAIYSGASALEKARAHREDPAPSLRGRCPAIPTELDHAFQKMVAKRPQDRFATMAEVIRRLERYASANVIPDQTTSYVSNVAPDSATVAATPSPRRPPGRRRGPLVVFGCVAAAAVLAAAAYYGGWGITASSDHPAVAARENAAGNGGEGGRKLSAGSHPAAAARPDTLAILGWVIEKKHASGSNAESPPVASVRMGAEGATVSQIRAVPDDLAPLAARHSAGADLRIVTIDLGNTAIQDEDLERLANLEHLTQLSLYGCKDITDAGLEHLAGMGTLQELDLRQTKVTPSGLERLAACPLGSVLLDGFHGVMTERAAAVLAADHADTLTSLVLQGVHLNEPGLREVARIPRLRRLDLADTGIASDWLQHLEGLTALEELVLDRNQAIDDRAVGHLRNLPSLTSVSLIGTAVVDRQAFQESLSAAVRF